LLGDEPFPVVGSNRPFTLHPPICSTSSKGQACLSIRCLCSFVRTFIWKDSVPRSMWSCESILVEAVVGKGTAPIGRNPIRGARVLVLPNEYRRTRTRFEGPSPPGDQPAQRGIQSLRWSSTLRRVIGLQRQRHGLLQVCAHRFARDGLPDRVASPRRGNGCPRQSSACRCNARPGRSGLPAQRQGENTRRLGVFGVEDSTCCSSACVPPAKSP